MIPENPFYRLAPFIQEYIYHAKWTELRTIQVQASQAIFDTSGHVLISSSTASGKTEAAFLPIITDLYNHESKSIGAIYIGPLKALLNDQFQRLQGLLDQTTITVQNWHGDIDQSKKQRFLQQAQGILQITPESLEAMLMQHHAELDHLFGDLRFVVIDEVHAFIGDDRGQQILCQLQRLARLQSMPPRRIGLSATLGDPQQAMRWLANGTDLLVTLVSDTVNRREVMIGLEHFLELPATSEKRMRRTRQNEDAEQLAVLQHLEQVNQAFVQHLYAMTRQEDKTLIFANTRAETEEIAGSLHTLAAQNNSPDIYYIHHGSVSATLRNVAETAMKEPDRPACVVATLTLELGIDLGQLDQVLQINATPSVTNFVQRLGRSGRRGNPAKMFFYSREAQLDDQTPLEKQIPWNLLEAIAIIQLYLEEKWIEPANEHPLPFSLLYHQTMSCVTAYIELMPPELADRVLTLAPFALVTQEHYRELLQHLLSIKHLERTESGGLIIGLEGEKIINDYHFYATFKDEAAYFVRDASGEIGTIQIAPAQGERFTLAGRTWKALEIDQNRQVIWAEQVAGTANATWLGGGKQLHRRILERMRQLLREDKQYGYLHVRAAKRLVEARQLANQHQLSQTQILAVGGDRYVILPWQGTEVIETMITLLEHEGLNVVESGLPIYFEVNMPQSDSNALRQMLAKIADHAPDGMELVAKLARQTLEKDKYDPFIPEHLLREAYLLNHLNIAAAIQALRQIAMGSEQDITPNL